MSAETVGNKGVADRYATALYNLANDQWLLDQVAANLRSLRAMLAESADLRRFISSPAVSRADLGRGIAALAARAEFVPLTAHFLGVLAANRRLSAVGEIASAYLDRLAAARGQVTADVISAYALSDADISALQVALGNSTGKAVTVEATVDPAILGGLVVRVGSKMIDSSLKTKLQRLKLSMKGVG